jgi:hypothetical protein
VTRRRAALVVCLVAAVAPCRTHADDLAPPPAGRTLAYACSGAAGHERRYTVRSVVGGVVTYDIAVDGVAGYAVKPLWLTGTSLYREMETGTSKAWITAGLENFNGLRTLAIGARYTGWIIEKSASGTVTRSFVDVAVVDERDYQSDALGTIRVTVIEETWTRGKRKQTGIAYVSRLPAAVAYWRRDGGSGTIEQCRLTVLRDR